MSSLIDNSIFETISHKCKQTLKIIIKIFSNKSLQESKRFFYFVSGNKHKPHQREKFMKNEIIAAGSILVLLVVNSLFWHWFNWLYNVSLTEGIALAVAVFNCIIIIFSATYFAQKFEK